MAQAVAAKGARNLVGPVLALAVVVAGMWPAWPYLSRAFGRARPHAPEWGLWNHLSTATQVHVVFALTALALGFVILARPKGRGLHKALGWTWVLSMGATAASSLFMTGLNGDAYSIIHLLSGWTLVALPLGIYAIRRRNLSGHRRTMLGLFLGGLMVAGLFAFLPGRFMFNLFFG